MSRPAVLFGGPSPEHDVSIITGLMAARALGDAECLYWSKSGEFFSVDENKRFAATASELCTDIVIIGATNRKALQEGAHEGRARVVLVDDRAGATAWVKENTAPGDVVLFENDLPDHFA